MNLHHLVKSPIFFERNRVFRVYRGGRLFAGFFGDDPEDGNYPEEWVASTTRALNSRPASPHEGLSIIQGTGVVFAEFLASYRQEALGGRSGFEVLVKLLDSAIRLPVQAHPDREFAQRRFGSQHGKTEMWLALATRAQDACIYYGFRDGVTRTDFARAIAASETDREAMPGLLNRLSVQPGDVYLIPPKMAHAIGQGCLILEVQEPTDFTVQPEAWCGDYRLNDREMYLGLDHETALDCFDFDISGERAIRRGRKRPTPWIDSPQLRAEAMITYADTPCFAVNRYALNDSKFTLTEAPAIYVVTAGQGEIAWQDSARALNKGDYFFLPLGASGSVVRSAGTIEVIECRPPKAPAR
ncbi:MAG: class I mannose-6-phosphate isomerase [Bryobacteraceae bacterium]|jgi:mannose-6-phosphate isomerase